MEIWKNIKGYEGLYQVSNLGRVKSLRRKYGVVNKKESIKQYNVSNNGYCRISLCKNGKKKIYLVHRLVAEAFIPNHNNKPQINHKDENKLNNKVNNLEWCDAKYNLNYGNRNQKSSKRVIQYNRLGQVIKIWDSITKAANELNIKGQNISDCCRLNRKTAGGYIWEYEKEDI